LANHTGVLEASAASSRQLEKLSVGVIRCESADIAAQKCPEREYFMCD
jgi:hypothetical protein